MNSESKNEESKVQQKTSFNEERFLNDLEASYDDHDNNDITEKNKRVGKITSVLQDFWLLDENYQKELIDEVDEYAKPIIATALVAHDMNETFGVIVALLTDEERMQLIHSDDGLDSNLLHDAMKNNSPKSVNFLLEEGIDPIKTGGSNDDNPLSLGIGNASFEAVEEFLKFFDKAKSKDELIKNQKIKRHALNECDNDKNTALHIVSIAEGLEMEEDSESKRSANDEGKNDLKKQMLELLFKHVGKYQENIFTKKNLDEKTAEDLFREEGNNEIADLIHNKHTDVLFAKLDRAILKMGLNKEKGSENGENIKALDDVLKIQKKIQKQTGGNYEHLDELIGPENYEPEKEFYKPGGRGQRLKWEVERVFDDRKFDGLSEQTKKDIGDLKLFLTQGGAKKIAEAEIANGASLGVKRKSSDISNVEDITDSPQFESAPRIKLSESSSSFSQLVLLSKTSA